jgi:ABC-2 type transport system permease protein
VRTFAFWTPFPYMVDVPARILAGETVPVLQSFAAMAAWAALFLPINLLLWRRGLRHYAAMGA